MTIKHMIMEKMLEVKHKVTVKDIKAVSTNMSDEEYNSYFNTYKQICEGCRNNCGICKDTTIINCYLHSKLPDGVWTRANINDVVKERSFDIADEINKKIMQQINKQ